MSSAIKKIAIAAAATFTIALAFFAGLYVDAQKATIYNSSGALSATAESTHSDIDLSIFWRAWDILNQKYIPTSASSSVTTTDENKIYGAVKGLAESLGDPYTTFLTPDEAKNLTSDLSGSLEGIGALLGIKDGFLSVTSVIKDSPAQKSGILDGDTIVKINEVSTEGIIIEDAVQKIRGKKGTNVTLTIKRTGRYDLFTITITRDTITTPVVETKKEAGGVFVVRVMSFTANSPELFRNALREFVDSGYSHIVLDLRNNTGGYLEAAVDMASRFLPPGSKIVTEDFGKNNKPNVYYSRGYNLFSQNMKIVILVNENTASASEILAGALRDSGRAVLVGTKTYGKGSVQELVPLTYDTLLKITVARWLTPNGTSISHNWINPDYEIRRTDDDIRNKKDPQMDKALDLARKL